MPKIPCIIVIFITAKLFANKKTHVYVDTRKFMDYVV